MEHGGEFFGFSDQLLEFRFLKEIELTRDVELSAEFAAGAFSDVQETDELFVAVAFVTFRDVGGHGKRGALHLILQRENPAAAERLKYLNSKPAATLPNLKIFKRLECHI
jgi:hypothetical protein